MKRFSIFLFLALSVIQLANADFYRCKMDDGTIKYSDTGCNGGIREQQYQYLRQPPKQQYGSSKYESNQGADSAARNLGFQSYSHYQQSRRICAELYNQYVTSRLDSSSCGADMGCLQQQAARMMEYSNMMTNSHQWKSNNCDVVAQVEANSNSSAKGEYEIEVSHNDELFIINKEKFKAKTYCFNMEEGDKVIFVDGSAVGVCTSATLVNMRTKNKCKVWCE